MRSESGLYIARLDQLRFFAASLIVLYHTFHRTVPVDVHPWNPLLLFADEGHTAVSLFLVISGFIFATLAHGSKVMYGPFIFNRFLRIYPLLIFAVMLGASLQRDEIFPLHLIFDYLTPLSSFGVNGPPLKLFPHLWSVMIEMQIYLLFPFLHRFQREYGDRYLWGLVGLLLVLRAIAYLTTGSAQPITYWTIFGRLDQFAIGMLLAGFSHRNDGRFRSPLWFVASLLLVYGVMLWLDRLGGFYGNGYPSGNLVWIARSVIEALAWGTVVVAYLHTSLTPGQLGSRVLSRLGEVSYSIYVVHLMVLWSVSRFLEKFTFVDDPWWNALLNGVLVVLPLTCALSFATYRLVERPFLRMRRHYLTPIAPAQPAGPSQPEPQPVTAHSVATR